MMVKLERKKQIVVIFLVSLGLILGYRYYFSPIRQIEKYSSEEDFSQFMYTAANDDYLYVIKIQSLNKDKLLVFDIANPDNTEIVKEQSFTKSLGTVMGMTIYNDFMFLVSQQRGILVFDISNPTSPHLEKEFNFSKDGHYYSPLLISNNIGYISEIIPGERAEDDIYKLHILYVGEPLSIKEISNILNGGKPLAKQGNYLYTAVLRSDNQLSQFPNHLGVLDVSDPNKPIIVKEFYDINLIGDMDIKNNLLYISVNDQLLVADASEPIDPIFIGHINLPVGEIIIHGNYLYYMNFFAIEVIDVSNPNSPRVIDKKKLSQARDFVLADGYLYLIDSYDGLFIYKTLEK